MIRINSYEELSKLIFSFLKKGVSTNFFLSRKDVQSEIECGLLYYFISSAGLWIVRKREEYYILNYYLNDFSDAINESLETFNAKLDKPIVVEIVAKDYDDEKYVCLCDFFSKMGFEVLVERERFCKKIHLEDVNKLGVNNVEKQSLKITSCEKSDIDDVFSILLENFDKLYGCIPSKKTLIGYIENNEIYKATCDGKLVGVLHISNDGKNSEIRHLAVVKEARNEGVASLLLEFYDNNITSINKTVWTGKDNLAAQRVYEKNGYKKDGYVSNVLSLQMSKKVVK